VTLIEFTWHVLAAFVGTICGATAVILVIQALDIRSRRKLDQQYTKASR
jgi:hypothetical protein